MASAFDLLWAAFIFFFDVRIMGFDVLPDVVGYVLMVIGLKRLASLNKHFATAARIAPIVALVSLADFYQPPAKGASILAFGAPSFTTPLGALLTVAGIVLVALNLFLVYHIITGIVELARPRRDDEVIERANSLLGEYKSLHILLMVFIPLAALVPAINWMAPLAQLAIGIVVYFGMMGFLRLAQWDLFGPDSKASGHK
jgi:hypothetical protein